jgi:hypothetical protein
MISPSEACKRRALDCERRATLATEPNDRSTYADLARQWRETADQAEDLDRKKIGKKKKPTKT